MRQIRKQKSCWILQLLQILYSDTRCCVWCLEDIITHGLPAVSSLAHLIILNLMSSHCFVVCTIKTHMLTKHSIRNNLLFPILDWKTWLNVTLWQVILVKTRPQVQYKHSWICCVSQSSTWVFLFQYICILNKALKV